MNTAYKVKCTQCNAAAINGAPCHEQGCNHFFTFTRLKRDYYQYNVYSLDVWGNRKDGYEVNDRCKVGSVMIPAECTDRQIIKALKVAGFLRSSCWYKSFTVGGDDNRHIDIDWRIDGDRPLLQLEIQ